MSQRFLATTDVLGQGGPLRADRFVAAVLGCSRAAAMRLCESGAVRVAGARAHKATPVAAGDEVEVLAAPPDDEALRPVPDRALVIDVLYEDGDVVAVCKPAGVPSHPLSAGETGTVANALVARYPECARAGQDPREGGLVQRLDRGTTGVLLAARTPEAWRALREVFSRHGAEKTYLALVVADRPLERTVIDLPIAHAPKNPARAMAVADPGRAAALGARPARTCLEPVEHLGDRALVAATTQTGRLHQVRVHLAAVGAPIVGDTRYGGPAWDAPGFFLHAERLVVPHPRTGARLQIEAALPHDRLERLDMLRGRR